MKSKIAQQRIVHLSALLAPSLSAKKPPPSEPTIPMTGPNAKTKLAVVSGRFLKSTKYVVMKVDVPVAPSSLTAITARNSTSAGENTEKSLEVLFRGGLVRVLICLIFN